MNAPVHVTVMMFKLTTVVVSVSRPANKAAEWYRDKLGLEIGGEAEGHCVVVAPKGKMGTPKGPWFSIHICEGDKPENGNTGILFLTKDIEANCKELKAKCVRFIQELIKEAWGTYAIFSNPNGSEFWLMSSG